MQLVSEVPPTLDLDQDSSGLKGTFVSSFPVQDADQVTLSTELEREDSREATVEEDEFDWSITLSNVHEMLKQARVSEGRIQAAEARAVRAEARAEKAEHWLRALHKAVLEEAPQRLLSSQ
ncbi:hypothetical protein [Methylobacterium iners]|uniref:hypothetical protein n=1 Tax=Methylobacterium iners TaxID=418707 RepID=UPI001EE1E983|nr:hypothetical protein [Methylobacterium iners]